MAKKIKFPKVIAYTDGSYINTTDAGGWAAYIESEQGQDITISGGTINTSNNRMEMYAILMVLRTLTVPCDLVIYSDSQYCINGIMDWMYKWARKNWMRDGELIPNHDLWMEIYDEVQKMNSVTCHWVKGHNGDPNNELVDGLAQYWSRLVKPTPEQQRIQAAKQKSKPKSKYKYWLQAKKKKYRD